MDRRDFLTGLATAPLMGLATGLGPAAALAQQPGAGAARAPKSEAALNELRETIARVDAGFADPAWRLAGPTDVAEARRYLLHTLQHALEAWLEADPARPVFKRFVTPEKKLLGDNPDAIYFTTSVDPARRYRIRGNTAGATYTSFTVELGTAEGHGSRRTGATLNDTQFRAEPDGSYQITVSAKEAPDNWLRLDPDAGSISTRHYYETAESIAADRMHHIPLIIEPLDDPGPAPAPTDASIAAGIRRVANFLRETVQPPRLGDDVPRWVSTVPNQLPAPRKDESNAEVGFAAVDNVYSMAPYLVKPGQALVIRGRFPPCRFANVVLWNRFMQTLDYAHRRTSLNRKQTRLEPDGSFKIVVAGRDPGVPNWIDTEGRMLGTIFFRFLIPEGEIEPLRSQRVALEEVADA